MPHRFAEIAFTQTVKKVQEQRGSRNSYARMEGLRGSVNQALGEAEAGFISARDSLYMATVSETGWPYIQHRGGPKGFVRVIDEHTIGFADFSGNRQYISVGNLMSDDRISMFFMDYPNKARLKLFGRAKIINLEDSEHMTRLEMPDYRARVERGLLIKVEGFDWNCPQHITERFTLDEVREMTAQHDARIAELGAQTGKESE
ncbi:MAG: pyridoxamine 5-phosphate oxidase [Alphaproteobacteria bacterium RIFOXYD12_FULL_60_8]|nr:MAG: pyridoxamine 5-phosphate oxidase [Alphaproteobacteria bacterium RIFOXYD12_FULL_60_8]